MSCRELLMLILPSLSVIANYALNTAQMELQGTEEPAPFDWLLLLQYGLSLAIILVLVAVFQGFKSGQEERRQNELLAGQIADMTRHTREVERLYQEIRGLRHDMENHIFTLDALYASGEREAARRYVETLRGRFAQALPAVRSGNPVTDVILTEKRRRAEEQGIAFACD